MKYICGTKEVEAIPIEYLRSAIFLPTGKSGLNCQILGGNNDEAELIEGIYAS